MNVNSEKVAHALAFLGREPELRSRFIELLQDAERLEYTGHFRDEISSHISDALHSEAGLQTKRLSNGLVFEFPYRSKIAREFVLASGVPNHVWEPQTTKLMAYLTANAKNVVVGGAYFGDQVILVADQIRKTGVVHAFEPNEVEFQALKRNVELNGLTNVVLNCAGLWDKDNATLRFVGEDALAGSEEIAGDSTEYSFPTFTIDQYAGSHEFEVDVIQLDTEGGEYRALLGARDQLVAHSPDIVFEVHSSFTDWSNGLENTDVVRYLRGLGYHVFAVRDFHHNQDTGNLPIELSSPEKTYLEGPPHGFNMLAVHELTTVENDLFRIVENVSPKYLLHKDKTLFHPLSS